MGKSHESKLWIVEVSFGEGSTSYLFRTRAKARLFAKAQDARGRHTMILPAVWGPDKAVQP